MGARASDPVDASDGGPGAARSTYYGRYQLLGELGAGGMGIVYEAYDPELDRRVALKVIGHAQRTVGTVARDRLLREARALARLAHPNVIVIHDVGSVGDEGFVAMELVQGRTLKEWLRACAPSLEKTIDVFVQAGRGLAAAHAVGLVHRDFKPSNVMVGDDGRARVLDFGLARLVETVDSPEPPLEIARGSTAPADLTRTGAIMGTPAYMAPEQCVGGEVDERTDQFSFCAALYEALYGMLPFPAGSLEERAARIAAGDLGPAPEASAVPGEVRAAILRGLRPVPADRHASMDALLAELAKASGTRRPRRGLMALATVIAIVALAGGGMAMRVEGEGERTPAAAAHGQGLRMQMVDSASELMARVSQHVREDEQATDLGIEPAAMSWRLEDGELATEHYLMGQDRATLERYLADLARTRSDLAPEPGHELLLEQNDGVWRTHYLWTRVELDGSLISRVELEDYPAGEPEITVSFDEQGRARLAAVTGQNVGRRLATVVDGAVTSSVIVGGPILGGVIAVSVDGPTPEARQRAAEQLAASLGRRP